MSSTVRTTAPSARAHSRNWRSTTPCADRSRPAGEQRQLTDPDPPVRLAAVNAMLRQQSNPHMPNVRACLLPDRKGPRCARRCIRRAIASWPASADPDPPDACRDRRGVADSLEPAVVRNGLTRLANSDPDDAVRAEAAAHRRRSNDRCALYGTSRPCSSASVARLGAGARRDRPAITFGVMGVINMAHGELIMLGAYTTYLIQQMPDMTGLSIAGGPARRSLCPAGRHRDRARRHPLSVWPATGDAAGDLRYQPDAAATGAHADIAAERAGVQSRFSQRFVADQQRAVADLQPPVHLRVLPAGVRRPVLRAQIAPASACRCARSRRTAMAAPWACARPVSMP